MRTVVDTVVRYVKLFALVIGVMIAMTMISLVWSGIQESPKQEEVDVERPELAMSAFWKAHHRIDSTAKEFGIGNGRSARDASKLFIQAMKDGKADLLGRVGESFDAEALERLAVYTQRTDDSIAVIVHVTEIRSYEDRAVREAIAASAWKAANVAITERLLDFADAELIVGLRGDSDYGPIWSGKFGAEPKEKTDGDPLGERLHVHFPHSRMMPLPFSGLRGRGSGCRVGLSGSRSRRFC